MRVIVAEDEKWVRATIIKTIPFEKLGLTLVSEASNGLDALKLCQEYKPDILLTDIMMPGLSGLELIEALHKSLPDIKIIIISGYNDFEYAKTAMQYGVCEYVLKPVDEVEISRVLTNVKKSIQENKKKIDEMNFYKKSYKQFLPLVHEKFLSSIIQPNQFTAEMIRMQLSQYGIQFSHPNFSILVFSPHTSSLLGSQEDESYFKFLIGKIMGKYRKGITFSKPGFGQELICILNHAENSPGGDAVQSALELCIRIFRKRFQGELSIGVSSAAQMLVNLPKLYMQACDALSFKFWHPDRNLFMYQPQKQLSGFSLKGQEEQLGQVELEIKLSNLEPAYRYVENILDHPQIKGKANPDQVKEFLWASIQTLLGSLNIQLSFIDHHFHTSSHHPYDTLRQTSNWNELSQCCKALLRDIHDFYLSQNQADSVNVMQTAKKIIDENYHKDISLEQVAKYVFLSPAYFSELFKKETGQSFIDYKTQLRIENAKKLIKGADLNISEVCSRVGYSDPKYFSKLFKKITGYSPYEYKEKT